jgi:hypothetical protein
MSFDGLAPYERQEYLAKIEQIRNQDVISERGLLNLVGYTVDGDFVIAPDSFSRGYQDAFLPPTERPYLVSNIVGLFGRLSSGGTWIFIPTYNRGMEYGERRVSDLKFVVLAEGQRRLLQENEVQNQARIAIQRQLQEAQEKIKELEERMTKSEKSSGRVKPNP